MSDRFEELLVNPILVTLARQRGNIDCGSLDSLFVRYGNFTQLVVPIPKGHVSIALDRDADLSEWERRLTKLVATLTKVPGPVAHPDKTANA